MNTTWRTPTAEEREARIKESIPRALKAWGLQIDKSRLAEPSAFDRAVTKLARVIRMIEQGKPPAIGDGDENSR